MTEIRDVLLRLIMAAPDPTGFDKSLPHYRPAWDEARRVLKLTCPKHIEDDGGTCPNCHADTCPW